MNSQLSGSKTHLSYTTEGDLWLRLLPPLKNETDNAGNNERKCHGGNKRNLLTLSLHFADCTLDKSRYALNRKVLDFFFVVVIFRDQHKQACQSKSDERDDRPVQQGNHHQELCVTSADESFIEQEYQSDQGKPYNKAPERKVKDVQEQTKHHSCIDGIWIDLFLLCVFISGIKQHQETDDKTSYCHFYTLPLLKLLVGQD